MIIISKLSDLAKSFSLTPEDKYLDGQKMVIICDTESIPVSLQIESVKHNIIQEFVEPVSSELSFIDGLYMGLFMDIDRSDDIYVLVKTKFKSADSLPSNIHVISSLKELPGATNGASQKTSSKKKSRETSTVNRENRENTTIEQSINKPVDTKTEGSTKQRKPRKEKAVAEPKFDDFIVSDNNSASSFIEIINSSEVPKEIKKEKLDFKDTVNKIRNAISESDSTIVLSMRMRMNIPDHQDFANKISDLLIPYYDELRRAL